jgi:hypothetical protein
MTPLFIAFSFPEPFREVIFFWNDVLTAKTRGVCFRDLVTEYDAFVHCSLLLSFVFQSIMVNCGLKLLDFSY